MSTSVLGTLIAYSNKRNELIEEDECAIPFQFNGCTATASFSSSGIGATFPVELILSLSLAA